MADHLVFQLHATLSSWGEPAVGEHRSTAESPSQSALVGLLGAALGLAREDEAAHASLRDDYGFATGLLAGGSLLRDYHTSQIPPRSSLKGRPQATRRNELGVPKAELSTVLSTRDYRQCGSWLVALRPRGQARFALTALANALREPFHSLYLGRKSCVPAAPLWPQVLDALSIKDAFDTYLLMRSAVQHAVAERRSGSQQEGLQTLLRIAFDDHVVAGVEADLTTRRKDRLIHRGAWQFGDRNEHVAVIAEPLDAPAED